MLNRLTDSLNFHGNALALRSERQRLIASNIANADTPGYVARDMDFARTLREATGSPTSGVRLAASGSSISGFGGASGGGLLTTTALAHFDGSTLELASATSNDKLLYATAAQTNLDGNTVDMDRERANFADNAVKYEATLRFINGNVRTTLDAIKGQG